MTNSKGDGVLSSLIWKFSERAGAQLVGLIIGIVLARIISPEDYASIALMTIFITISNVFVEAGFSSALIQKKDPDDLDYSTVFHFNLIISIFIYILLFLFAPLISNFFGANELVKPLRVLGLIIIISGFKSVQVSYVSKKMLFKKFFFSTLSGTIFSGIVGIFLALNGFGVWALVFQQLSNNFVDTLILFITINWKPKLIFSFDRLRKLFSFGSKIFLGSIIDSIYNNIYDFIIGKKFDKKMLAFFNKGKQFPQLFIENIDCSIQSVMFPVYAKNQDNIMGLKKSVKNSVKLSCFVIFPIMFGLAAISDTFIKVLLTDKWIDCSIYLQLMCAVYCLHPIQLVNIQIMKATGKGGMYLLFDIIKKIFGIIIVLFTLRFGVFYIALGLVICSIFETILNMYSGKKLAKYGYIEQFADIFPSLICSVTMFVSVYFISYYISNIFILLFVQIIFGLLIYFSLSFFVQKDMMMNIKTNIYSIFSNK